MTAHRVALIETAPPSPQERRRKHRTRAIVAACLGVVFGIGAVADAATGHTALVWSPLVVAVIFGLSAVREARLAKGKG